VTGSSRISSVRCGSRTGYKVQHQPTKGVDMTDNKDRKKLSDEELKDVAGGDNLRGSVTVEFIKSKKDDDKKQGGGGTRLSPMNENMSSCVILS